MQKLLLVGALVVAAATSGGAQSRNRVRVEFMDVRRPLTVTVSRAGTTLTAVTFQPSTVVSIAEDGLPIPENTVGYHGNIEIRALFNPPASVRDAALALRDDPSVVVKFANADVTLKEE